MSANHQLRQFTVKVKSGDLREEITVLAASTGEALSIAKRLMADDETCAVPATGLAGYVGPAQLNPRIAA